MADKEIVGAIVAGVVVAVIAFIFFMVFLTHCLCPWRNALMPWRKKDDKKVLINEESIISTGPDFPDSNTREQKPRPQVPKASPEPQVKVKAKSPPKVKRVKSPVVMRQKEPQVLAEPPPKSSIVATIAATIDQRKSTSDELSYQSVQERTTKLSPIAELNLLSQDEAQIAEDFLNAKPHTASMSVVNVRHDNDELGSMRSGASLVKSIVSNYDSQPRHHGLQEYDRSSVISASSRVSAMVHAMNTLHESAAPRVLGSSLSRQNSDVSSVYSKADLPKKYKTPASSELGDNIAMHSLDSKKGSDTDSYMQPELPIKGDYDNNVF